MKDPPLGCAFDEASNLQFFKSFETNSRTARCDLHSVGVCRWSPVASRLGIPNRILSLVSTRIRRLVRSLDPHRIHCDEDITKFERERGWCNKKNYLPLRVKLSNKTFYKKTKYLLVKLPPNTALAFQSGKCMCRKQRPWCGRCSACSACSVSMDAWWMCEIDAFREPKKEAREY